MRYGERMSGVVDLDTLEPEREPRTSLYASNVSIGARTAGAISNGEDVEGLIAARTGRMDNLMSRLLTDVQSPTFADGLGNLLLASLAIDDDQRRDALLAG